MFRRTITFTGLSDTDPLTGNYSEIDFTPGSGANPGSGGGTGATFALYADVPESITSSNGVVSAWGIAVQASPTSRPTTESDSVTGRTLVRFDAGHSLIVPSGTLDFASQGAVSFAFVFRQRIYAPGVNYVLYDSTNGGATRGVQIVVNENPANSRGRQIYARLFDGASWIVDYNVVVPADAYEALLWSVAIITITSTTMTVMVDGFVWLTVTYTAITFPAGAASAATLGNYPADLLAFEVWQGGLSASAALATKTRLQARFGLPYSTITLWTDPNLGETDPSGCTLSDNTYVALATKNPGPGSNIGRIQSRTSADGITWTPSPGSDGSNDGNILPFTAPIGGGMFDSTVTQLSDGSVLAVANQTTLIDIHTLKAANAAAVRSNTWTGETNVSSGAGTRTLDICASDPTERPGSPGEVYLCSYSAFGAEAFWSAYHRKSTDYGVTFGAPVRVLDGVALSKDLAEPGLKFVTAAAAAKYSDLTTGQFFYLVRSDSDVSMIEVTSTTGLAGSFTARATNLVAFSAARFLFLQDGTLVALLRDQSYQFNTIYRRTGVSGGVAQYTAAPIAPAVVPAFLNQNNGQYGNICKEVTAGLPLVITANRLDVNRCDAYARFFPEWQLYGQMPIVVSPATVAGTKNPGDTVQFSALGAGNYVWSMTANAPGCTLNSSTGLLTVGTLGGNVTVRCTDLNGYFDATQNVTITCNAAANALADAANLVFHFDPSKTGEVTAASNLANSITNENGAASALTSGASNKPGYGLTTLNALNTLDFSAGKIMNTTLPGSLFTAFTDFAFIVVFKSGSSVAGAQTFGGNATSGFVCRMDAGVIKTVDYAGGVLVHSYSDLATVTANTAHVVAFRRTGTTLDVWLDGVKSTSPATVSASAHPVGWPIGNDDSASLFGEQLLGFLGEIGMWSHAPTDGNITTSMAALKAKWGTT